MSQGTSGACLKEGIGDQGLGDRGVGDQRDQEMHSRNERVLGRSQASEPLPKVNSVRRQSFNPDLNRKSTHTDSQSESRSNFPDRVVVGRVKSQSVVTVGLGGSSSTGALIDMLSLAPENFGASENSGAKVSLRKALEKYASREQLVVLQSIIEARRSSELAVRLNVKALNVFPKGVTYISPRVSILEALSYFLEEEIEFALIGHSLSEVVGVISGPQIRRAVYNALDHAEGTPVSHIMNRMVCIESEAATISEVLDRMTRGACPCTILLNKEGVPQACVSPREMNRALLQILDELDIAHPL